MAIGRGAQHTRGASVIRSDLRLLRMVTLRLRQLHRRYGAHLATWSVGIGIFDGGRAYRGRNRHCCWRSSPTFGHARSDHDELVWAIGLGTQLLGSTPTHLGDTAPKRMVRARRELGVGRRRLGGRLQLASGITAPRFARVTHPERPARVRTSMK